MVVKVTSSVAKAPADSASSADATWRACTSASGDPRVPIFSSLEDGDTFVIAARLANLCPTVQLTACRGVVNAIIEYRKEPFGFGDTPMRKTVTALAALMALGACGTVPSGGAETETVASPATVEAAPAALTQEELSAKINAWFDEQYEEELQFSPIGLTFLGRKEQYDTLGDFSVEAFLEQAAWKKASVEDMEATFDYDALSPEDQISYDIWKYQSEQTQAGIPYIYNGFTFDQMNGAQSFVPTFLINFHRVDDKSDMEAYVARIKDVAPQMDNLLDIAREASSQGVATPLFALEGVIEQSEAIITGQPFNGAKDSDIWADVKSEIATLVENEAISEAEATVLRSQARVALQNEFKPVYQRIIAWAEGEKAKAPEISTGVGGQPNGEAFYNYRLADQTTTNLTADEIHEIGLSEVARLRAEMETIKDKVGFEGTLQEFFTELRDNKDNEKYYFPNTDEGRQGYITEATAAIEKIKTQLPNFFGRLPKADLVVRRVEPFREQDGAAQHYYPGTPDGSRDGIYYAHLSDMTSMPKRELEVIAYHEGLPGHHMQISIAQELEGVPQFRTQAGFTAYVEGWALYSEKLSTEMDGTFEDPYSDFGRLGSEIWRAIRLVVDTGLHSKGWTEQEALDYFLANAAAPEQQARSEIQRYIVMPGQATSYKIGMIKIQELRAKAEAELGDAFDIKAFHDTVLGGGAMPLGVLERRVDLWIEDVKAS